MKQKRFNIEFLYCLKPFRSGGHHQSNIFVPFANTKCTTTSLKTNELITIKNNQLNLVLVLESFTYTLLVGPISIIGGIGFGTMWGLLSKYIPEKEDVSGNL